MSAARIFDLVARQPLIDNYSTEGLKPVSVACERRIQLFKVTSFNNMPISVISVPELMADV